MAASLLVASTFAFLTPPPLHAASRLTSSGATPTLAEQTPAAAALTDRRQLLRGAAACFLGLSGASMGPAVPPAFAENKWISGKSDPIRPTSKDKDDGTKKDYRYIKCLNDCVPRKQGPPGPSQKDRVDCLDACQQECCFTYEQCTYSIRK